MPEIVQSFGATVSLEIEGLFLSMSSILEDHFVQLRSRLDEVESNSIGGITDNKSIPVFTKKVEELMFCEKPHDSSAVAEENK